MLPEAGARPPEFFAAEIEKQIPAFGLSLDPPRVSLLARYLAELDLWRRRTNLTGPLSAEELVSHSLEAALGEKLIPHGIRLLDIGSGAGLPGIPLAIARPDIAVTLLEPRGRRAAFLRHAARTVPVGNSEVLEVRVQSLEEPSYHVATARAVGTLAEQIGSAPFLAPAGALLAWTTDAKALEGPLARLFSLETVLPVPGSRRRVIALLRAPLELDVPRRTIPSGHNPPPMGRIIAIANQKGGVGKTTTAINLGAALAAFDRKVLIVDLDAQANATSGLGFSREREGPDAYDVLMEGDAISAIRPTAFPNLSLLPSGRDLVGAEVELVNRAGREGHLRAALDPVRADYEFLFVDCPPALSLLTVNALTAADSVLVPIQTEYFALEGLTELLETIERVKLGFNPSLAVEGIVLTMHDDRTNLGRQVTDDIRRHFGDEVYRTVIPRNVRLGEAPSFGKPVLAYDVKSRGAEAYLALAREFLKRRGGRS